MARGKDLPEPEWWARARRYKEHGMRIVDIAETMGRSPDGVAYALNPEKYRNKRRQYAKTVHGPRPCDQRNYIRAEARLRWRSDGRSKPLEHYYRQLDCL